MFTSACEISPVWTGDIDRYHVTSDNFPLQHFEVDVCIKLIKFTLRDNLMEL